MLLTPARRSRRIWRSWRRCAAWAPVLPVGVDGSVTPANVVACLEAGARYVVAGRALLQLDLAQSELALSPAHPHSDHRKAAA